MGTLVLLSLLRVIALNRTYRSALSLLFVIAFSLLCTCFLISLIPLRSNFFSQNWLFLLVICTLKTRISIKSRWHLALQRYSDNVILHFASLYNASLLKVIAYSSSGHFWHPKVIAVSTVWVVIASKSYRFGFMTLAITCNTVTF